MYLAGELKGEEGDSHARWYSCWLGNGWSPATWPPSSAMATRCCTFSGLMGRFSGAVALALCCGASASLQPWTGTLRAGSASMGGWVADGGAGVSPGVPVLALALADRLVTCTYVNLTGTFLFEGLWQCVAVAGTPSVAHTHSRTQRVPFRIRVYCCLYGSLCVWRGWRLDAVLFCLRGPLQVWQHRGDAVECHGRPQYHPMAVCSSSSL